MNFDRENPEHAQFAKDVKDYVSLHDSTVAIRKETNRQLAQAKASMAQLADSISEVMAREGWQELQLSDGSGKLKRAESKRTESLKKSHILAELAVALGDKRGAEEALERMLGQRAVQVKGTLRRTHHKAASAD